MRGFDFDVFRERHYALDEGARRIESARAQPGSCAELRYFRGEEFGHINDRRIIFAEGFDPERLYDRVIVGRLHSARDGQLLIGHNFIGYASEQNAIAVSFPSDDVIACRLSAVAYAERGAGNLADPEKFFVQLAPGDFVIDFVFDAMNGENSLV